MVANCGIRRVVFEEEYPDPLATGILTTSGVELWKWDAKARQAARVPNPNTFEQAQARLREKWRSGELSAQPPPGAALGQLPMAGQMHPSARRPAETPWSVPVQGGEAVAPPQGDAHHPPLTESERAEAEAATDEETRVRDLRDDPRRAELIRRLAREKVERKRRAMEEAGR
jgi:hypothetical protein